MTLQEWNILTALNTFNTVRGRVSSEVVSFLSFVHDKRYQDATLGYSLSFFLPFFPKLRPTSSRSYLPPS